MSTLSEHLTAAGDLPAAGRALAAAGLVDAFGHVSARAGSRALMTPPQPLGTLRSGDDLVTLGLDDAELASGAPREGWIHVCVYRARPEAGAICRAQPPAVSAAGVAGVTIRALHGQGAFLGREVPVFDQARLVRDRERGEALAAALGEAPALVLRGNGAITVAADVGRAVALMWVLERSARLNLEVAAAGRQGRELYDDEYAAWQAAAPELLDRLWDHLRGTA